MSLPDEDERSIETRRVNPLEYELERQDPEGRLPSIGEGVVGSTDIGRLRNDFLIRDIPDFKRGPSRCSLPPAYSTLDLSITEPPDYEDAMKKISE